MFTCVLESYRLCEVYTYKAFVVDIVLVCIVHIQLGQMRLFCVYEQVLVQQDVIICVGEVLKLIKLSKLLVLLLQCSKSINVTVTPHVVTVKVTTKLRFLTYKLDKLWNLDFFILFVVLFFFVHLIHKLLSFNTDCVFAQFWQRSCRLDRDLDPFTSFGVNDSFHLDWLFFWLLLFLDENLVEVCRQELNLFVRYKKTSDRVFVKLNDWSRSLRPFSWNLTLLDHIPPCTAFVNSPEPLDDMRVATYLARKKVPTLVYCLKVDLCLIQNFDLFANEEFHFPDITLLKVIPHAKQSLTSGKDG